MALPLALAVMLVLTILVSAVIEFSSANSRGANVDVARQRAKVAAEAGFNSAASIAAVAPSSATLPDCAAWSSWTVVAGGDEARWCGSYDAPKKEWAIKAQGRTGNPSGPGGAPLTRTVEGIFKFVLADAGAWNFVWVKPADGTCMLIKNAFVMDAPLYVKGNLCIDNEARYGGPRLYVTGTIQTQNTGSVGTAAAPTPRVSVRDNSPNPSGCRYTTSGSFELPCSPAHRVWATNFDNNVPDVDKPPVYFDDRYADARPGLSTRGHSCTSSNLSKVNSKFTSDRMDDNDTRDSSIGVMNLMPNVAYSCIQRRADGSELGRVEWSGTNPGTLTVGGTFFVDGTIETANDKRGVVNGEGVIYANNQIILQSNSWVCGVADCGLSWTPEMDPPHLLFLIAGYSGHPAIEVKSDAKFQGGLYAVGGLKVSNNGYVHGPAIADHVEAENGADFNPWPWFVDLPDGAPSDGDYALRLKRGSWRG